MILKSYISSFLEENTYVVEEADKVYLIDPGDVSSDIIDEIGVKQKLFVILTHAHIDHIAGISRLTPDGIYIHPSEKTALLDNHLNLGFYFDLDILINTKNIMDISELPDEWQIFNTPGHTSGSVCLLYANEYLFTGDTLFADSIGRTDFPGGDAKAMNYSIGILKGILENNLDFLILPGHGRSGSAREVLKTNPFLR